MTRRATFGALSQLAIHELKKNMELIEEEGRLQTAKNLIQRMEDCSTLSKKLDFIKNSKNKKIKMSRSLLNKITTSRDTVRKFSPNLDDIISRFERPLTLIFIFNIVYFTLKYFKLFKNGQRIKFFKKWE